jgi:hypothetical protein
VVLWVWERLTPCRGPPHRKKTPQRREYQYFTPSAWSTFSTTSITCWSYPGPLISNPPSRNWWRCLGPVDWCDIIMIDIPLHTVKVQSAKRFEHLLLVRTQSRPKKSKREPRTTKNALQRNESSFKRPAQNIEQNTHHEYFRASVIPRRWQLWSTWKPKVSQTILEP